MMGWLLSTLPARAATDGAGRATAEPRYTLLYQGSMAMVLDGDYILREGDFGMCERFAREIAATGQPVAVKHWDKVGSDPARHRDEWADGPGNLWKGDKHCEGGKP